MLERINPYRSPLPEPLFRAASTPKPQEKPKSFCQSYRHAHVARLVEKLSQKLTPYHLEVRSFEVSGRRFPVVGVFTAEIEKVVVDAYSSFTGPALRDLEGAVQSGFILRDPVSLMLVPESRWQELSEPFGLSHDQACVGEYKNRHICIPLYEGQNLAKNLSHELVHALFSCRFTAYEKYLNLTLPPEFAKAINEFRKRRKLEMTANHQTKVFSTYAYWDPILVQKRDFYIGSIEDERIKDRALSRDLRKKFQGMDLPERKRQAYLWYVQNAVAEEFLAEAWGEYVTDPNRLSHYEPELFLYMLVLHESIMRDELKTWDEMIQTTRYLKPNFFRTEEGQKLIDRFVA